jgi:hypothetical protein
VSKARENLALLQKAAGDEKKKILTTATKKDTRNLNLKSSDSVERYN